MSTSKRKERCVPYKKLSRYKATHIRVNLGEKDAIADIIGKILNLCSNTTILYSICYQNVLPYGTVNMLNGIGRP